MSNKLSKVFGFYYKIGSIDFPFNMDPDANFGFNLNSETIFKYSINEVEKAFVKCRSISKRSSYDTSSVTDETGSINVLLADSNGAPYSTGIHPITTEDVRTTEWDNAFKIMEYLGQNQSTCTNGAQTPGYLNAADEALGDINSPFYVHNYVLGSISLQPAAGRIPQRLSWATWQCKGFPSGNVSFQIYFDADYFVERSDNISYKVYRYVEGGNDDPDGLEDNHISDDEFDSLITSKLHQILHTGKYPTYSRMSIDKRISDTETIEEQFFVFSSIKQTISNDIMRTQIKEYLRNYYADDVYLRYTYPTLFDENEIRIIPLWGNTLSTVGGSEILVHPLTLLDLSETLIKFGFNIAKTSSDYRATEIFYVGPGSGWTAGTSFDLKFPLLAIEVDTSSGIIKPISKRFPAYKPIYGTKEEGDAGEFHYILITILSYLNGTNHNLVSTFVTEYSVSEGEDQLRKTVTFNYAGDIWTIYGPPKS